MSLFCEIKNLSVSLAGRTILENISFSLEKGSTLAIIGPNGAGKSVLLRTLLGVFPYKGEIIWHHKPIFGYVPQRFEINRSIPLNVEELFLAHSKNKNFWLPSRQFKSEALDNLAHVGGAGLWNERLGALSPGQLQRVLIAYALLGSPNIMFFDEPTASVDVEGEVVIQKLLRHLAGELGITLVIVTHDLDIAYKFADTILCLNHKMVCFGPSKEMLTSAQLEKLYGTGEEFTHLHHHE